MLYFTICRLVITRTLSKLSFAEWSKGTWGVDIFLKQTLLCRVGKGEQESLVSTLRQAQGTHRGALNSNLFRYIVLLF